MESKQIQTCSMIWNYSSYLVGVFLCKISPRTKRNWHYTIGFLTLFFRKEYILFSNVYISVNTIFECCYLLFGWEIGHPLSTCACGRGVSRLMCTYALTDNYSFHVFVLRCLVLTFIKKGVLLYIFESPQKTGIRFS